MKTRFVSAIVPAAGSATRMGGEKQRLLLDGVPVLARTLLVLQQTDAIDEIVVVARKGDVAEFSSYKERFSISKLSCVVEGGDTRQQSVQRGLFAISSLTTVVAVHDGARPLVTSEEIERIIAEAEQSGGATAATPVKDTLKVAAEDGSVVATPDRRTMWAVQTPQVFCCATYREAMEMAVASGLDFTDDCQLFEHAGHTVRLVCTGYQNIKITTPEDIAVAKAFLEEEVFE